MYPFIVHVFKLSGVADPLPHPALTCFKKNIGDYPNCVFGESENNRHYLFECPLYNHIRLTLFDKLRQIPSIQRQ